MAVSVFADVHDQVYKYKFAGTLHADVIAGGTPSDPNVAEAWLRTKLGLSKDEQIREQVAEVMLDRGIDADAATKELNTNKHLNGFKRDRESGELYIEGRQLKAALKEAASVAMAANNLKASGWGKTRKGLLGYLAEHVFVVESRLYLGVKEPSGVNQRFVHTFRGSGIQYEEYVEQADIDFTVIADHPFEDREWGVIWVCGEQQGLGASRSQGFGRYQVTKWEPLKLPSSRR
jgi:hypothetical protein